MKKNKSSNTLKLLSALFLLLHIPILIMAQEQTEDKKEVFIPPGTIPTQGLYFDEYEVSNYAWVEYLGFLKRDSTYPQYIAALPDTTVWYNIFPQEIADDYVLNYLYDAATSNYPVVGVSYWQAVDYCFWRSTVINSQLKNRNLAIKVNYRLPTPDEWEKVAMSTAAYNESVIDIPREKIEASFDRNRMRNIRNIIVQQNPEVDSRMNLEELRNDLVNFFVENPLYLFENIYFENQPYFWPVLRNGQSPLEISYGDLPIKNLRGNVSEMTSIRNVAKGGNWTTTPEESKAQYDLIYYGASALVGFRCVCDVEVLEKEIPAENKDSTQNPDKIDWDN